MGNRLESGSFPAERIPANHWLDDHLAETGETSRDNDGFYALLDDDSVIQHIPDGPVYEVQIDPGDSYEREALREYAQLLTAYYQHEKLFPVDVTAYC